jgi:hypothetical protein
MMALTFSSTTLDTIKIRDDKKATCHCVIQSTKNTKYFTKSKQISKQLWREDS